MVWDLEYLEKGLCNLVYLLISFGLSVFIKLMVLLIVRCNIEVKFYFNCNILKFCLMYFTCQTSILVSEIILSLVSVNGITCMPVMPCLLISSFIYCASLVLD